MNTQEIFEKKQVLTVAKARELKGKKIACTSSEYKMNIPQVSEFIVGEIISEWDLAAKRQYPDQQGKFPQYENYQQYWASYMNERQIQEQKTKLVLFSLDGKQMFVAHTKYYNYYPEATFTGSDADREVYFVMVEETITKYIIVFEKLHNDNRPNPIQFGKTEFLKSLIDGQILKTFDLWSALTFDNVLLANNCLKVMEQLGYEVDIYSYATPNEN